MHGTWKTAGGGRGLAGGAVLVLAAGAAVGVAEGVKESVHEIALIAAGLVLTVAALAWLVVVRVLRARTETGLLVVQHQPEPERPAIPRRERPQITNVFIGGQHVHGTAPAPVVQGEILRRTERRE